VDVQHAIDEFFAGLSQGYFRRNKADVIEGVIKTAELLDRECHEFAVLLIDRDITAFEQGFAARGPDEGDGLITARLVNVGDDDSRAVPGERDRGGPADSIGWSAHHRHLFLELWIYRRQIFLVYKSTTRTFTAAYNRRRRSVRRQSHTTRLP